MGEKEYIERGVAIEFVKRYSPTVDGFTTLQCVENAIKEIPAADVVEVRHGRWITKGENGLLICSECGTNRPFDVQGDKIEYWQGNFCNICGAKMDGERKEQK